MSAPLPTRVLSGRSGRALRAVSHIAIDGVLVALALYIAFYVRFDGDFTGRTVRYENLFLDILPWVVAGKLAILAASGAYTKVWRYVSLRDMSRLLQAVVVATLLLMVAFYFFDPPVSIAKRDLPRSILFTDLVFTAALLAGVRFATRAIIERPPAGLRLPAPNARKVLIIGAGDTGVNLARQMERDRALGYVPIGFVTEFERYHGRHLAGIKVKGGLADLPEILQDGHVNEVVLAMPNATQAQVRRVVEDCQRARKPLKTVPTVEELLAEQPLARRLKPIQIEDVLGRDPVKVDLRAAAGYVTGETVLVTGAGGSIGSELCRQLVRAGARTVVLVDHAEDNLFRIDHELRTERGFGGTVALVADAKNAARIDAIIADHRPVAVFHAAAYKHVPLMQHNAVEAVRNNVLSTAVVAEACAAHGVPRFVLVSTDKAVAPSTVMGATKALAERVVETLHAEGRGTTRFMAVRFGNVLGSSGSVLPIFRRQLELGGPLTVTDKRMTRYFMTIPEAASLVVQAGALGEGGEVFLLDMGEPVRIWDLAHQMVRLSGQDHVQVVETAIRPGEKLHEVLIDEGETRRPTVNPKITHVEAAAAADPSATRAALAEMRELTGAEGEDDIKVRLSVLLGRDLTTV